MDQIQNGFQDSLGPYLPRILGALAILVVGWILAAIVSSIVRRVLRSTDLDNRLARLVGDADENAEQVLASVVFWVIMLLVFVAALETLALTTVTGPLRTGLDQIFEFLPRLVGAAIILVIAWVVARVVRAVLERALTAVRVDERIGGQVGAEDAGLATSLSEAGYWLVFLLFLPALLGALEVQGMLAPVQGMVDEFLGFLPNLIAAGLILVVGWFVATIVRRIATNLSAALGLNALAERAGVGDTGQQSPAQLLGLVLYVLILLPALVAALDALEMQAVSAPTSNMLDTILQAIPAIFAAALVLIIAFVIGRIVANLIASVLAGAGFDGMPRRLGLQQDEIAGVAPSNAVGALILAATMLFATLEAVELLGFELLGALVAEFVRFGGQILMGLVVIAIGLWLANVAANAVRTSAVNQAGLLAIIARVAIIAFAGAIGLREMGIANEIIILAFGLPLGALALAAAIAIGVSVGVGGREVAAEELDSLRNSIRRS